MCVCVSGGFVYIEINNNKGVRKKLYTDIVIPINILCTTVSTGSTIYLSGLQSYQGSSRLVGAIQTYVTILK